MRKGKQRGLFFCAVVGHDSDYERTYLRFIPATPEWEPTGEENSIIHELGTCLRMIECEEETPTWIPDGVHERVYDFWDIAQTNILDHWMRETDPANLQPKVGRINHQVAEFIRAHPPREIGLNDTKNALDILESPWPRREQIMLRGWFKFTNDQDQQNDQDLSRDLVNNILGTGLQASEPPLPLPLIEKDDVKLLCWMAIECEKGHGALP